MRDAQLGTESIKDVFAFVAEHGCKLTSAQVRRYQQEGVIPKPKLIGLGRGRGTKVVYPAGTGQQLVAACEALSRNRSFRVARWRLWWANYPIASAHIRSTLHASLFSSEKPDLRLPREVKSRLHGEQLKRFEEIGYALSTGKIERISDPTDERLVARGMGIPQQLIIEMKAPDYWPVPGLGNFLGLFSQLLSPRNLKQALRHSTDADLKTARDEVRVFLSYAGRLADLLDRIGPAKFGNVLRKVTDLSVSEQRSSLLAWLCARRNSEVLRAYQGLIKFLSETGGQAETRR